MTITWPRDFEPTEVKLLDLQGRILIATSVSDAARCSLWLSEIAPGAYFVEAVSANGVLRGRILVAR